MSQMAKVFGGKWQVLLLAGLLQKHLAKAAPKAASTAHVHGAQAG